MNRFHEQLSRMREEWVLHGKRQEYLAPPLTAALADLWLYHKGGGPDRPENVLSVVDPDGLLQAFVDKSLEGVDVMEVWSKRGTCRGCGETYMLENMITCTDCHRSICWQCETWQGNSICRRCSCGGEMY